MIHTIEHAEINKITECVAPKKLIYSPLIEKGEAERMED